MSEVQKPPNRLVKRRPVPTYPDGTEAPVDAPVFPGTNEAIPEPEKEKKSKWRMSNPFDKKSKNKEKEQQDSATTVTSQRNPHDSAYFSTNDPGSSVSEIGSTPNQRSSEISSTYNQRPTESTRTRSGDRLAPPRAGADEIAVDSHIDRPASDKTPSDRTDAAVSEPAQATQHGNSNDQRVQTTTTTTTVTETRILGGDNGETKTVVNGAGDQGAANVNNNTNNANTAHQLQPTETAPSHVPNPNSQTRPPNPRNPSGPTIPHRSPNRDRVELSSVQTPQPQLSEAQPQYPVPQQYPVSHQQQQQQHPDLVSPVSPSRPNFSYPRTQQQPTSGNPQPPPLSPAYAPDNSKPETGARIGTLGDLKAAASTLHGAGETLRGTLFATTDKAFHGHDPAVLAQHEQIINNGRAQMEKGRVGPGEARQGGRITGKISEGWGRLDSRIQGRKNVEQGGHPGGLTGNPVNPVGGSAGTERYYGGAEGGR